MRPSTIEPPTLPDAAAVLELLAVYLASDLGRAELRRVEFGCDRLLLERQHRLMAEARRCLRTRGSFSFADWVDPRPLLTQAGIPGWALGALELLALARFLEAATSLSRHLRMESSAEAGEGWPELSTQAGRIGDYDGLVRRLRAAIAPGGELEDTASAELGRIRRQRGRQRQAIEASLGRHLRQLGGEGVLQDELITVRNERFVLPVRADLRRKAPGVVHGASSSGQTLFVEPLETIELNNENIRLRDEELAEIHRILARFTAEIAAEADGMAAAAGICGRLELELAKARFAHDYQASEAEFNLEGEARLQLDGARHPLLVATLRGKDGHAVVPLSLAMEAERVLVISGPNTGGKTVVLKTIGMAAWMAQCGLPVCAARARLPVFDAVWADVGDVQSIEQNLSTFSSHLLHIRNILERATPRSLVLLDELGTATNAAEGAALAVAIAEDLRERRVWALISTHHDALKAWAATEDDVANASVGVEAETLRPNYQFRFGVPGLSAGLAMAERLGLPAPIVAAARGHMSRDEVQAGEYLQRLQAGVAAAETRLRELDAREAELRRREVELEARDRSERQREAAKARADLEKRLAAFLRAAEANWHQVIEELKDEVLNRAQRRKLEVAGAALRRQTGEAFQTEFGEHLGAGTASVNTALAEAAVGDRVRVRSLRAEGKVLRKLDDGFEVEVGHLRVRVPAADIAGVMAPGAWARTATEARRAVNLDATLASVREINLVGMRLEEAMDKLDKFLDDAILGAVDQVRIVHGAGFGVLRKAVGEALTAHPAVARHHHPPQNQGGNGVTIAEMKA